MLENTCAAGCACQHPVGERGSVSRRGVLAGTAGAVAALALAACAAPEETTSGTTTQPATDPGSASATATSSGESPTATQGETPTEEPLAGTGDFPVGGGVIAQTADGPIVVTHPTDADFLGFNARCPHAGCTVAEVTENTIHCACHGSVFDGSTGDRLEGPAPRGLAPVQVRVEGGQIFLA